MAGETVALLSLYEQACVVAAYGTRVIPDGTFNLADKPDLLIVPGGGWLTRSSTGAWAEANKGSILSLLKDAHAAGVILASVCTGSLLLGKAGLLAGRRATTNHAALGELEEMGVRLVDARVVDDGDIITAAGITSSLDLGLRLVERLCGHELATNVSSQLEFELRIK